MAHTFSKSANVFIDNNSKIKTSTFLAEMAVNMAVNDLIGVVRTTIIEFCPHKEACSQQYSRYGCSTSECTYVSKNMNLIKSDQCLCFKLNK